MDALSHALIVCLLASHPALSPVLPFAVLGAVLPDTDIFFPVIADRTPALYLFTHGGIAHSLAGVSILSLIGYGCILLAAAAGILPAGIPAGAGIAGLAAVIAGGVLHLAIDMAACPGIPVLAPVSDRKYTLGILPGPSILLALCAIGAVAITACRLLPFPAALLLYGGTVAGYLAARSGMYLIADMTLSGTLIPLINPLRWLVIREDGGSYHVRHYTFCSGYSDEAVFKKYQGVDPGEVTGSLQSAEVRRMVYSSYCVTAERIGDVLILADPIREKGYLHYPPDYRRVAVPWKP